MKIAKLASFVALTFALSACGGGGSGGGSTPQAKQPNINSSGTTPTSNQSDVAQPNNTVNKPSEPEVTKPAEPETAKPSEPETAKPSGSETSLTLPKEENAEVGLIKQREFPKGEVTNEDVGFGIVTGYNNQYSFNGAWKEQKNKDQLTGIIIDKTKATLAKTFIGSAGGLSGYLLANAFEAGWNVVTDDGSKRDTFYFGSETPISVVDNLKGKAVYKGIATRYDNISASLSNAGVSTLNVDFDMKKISGELAMKGLRRNIALKETDIKGNGFAGNAAAGENSVFITRNGTYEGKFFGPNAEEVAGEVRFEQKDLNTSFSAEKQTK